MLQARFFRCTQCALRFPALEEVRTCPRCGGELVFCASRWLHEERRGKSAVEVGRLPLRAVLDNLRSAWNVGSLFRTADATGFQHLHLCGITPTPPHEGIAKTALGAEQAVPWSYHPDAVQVVEELRALGWTLWALETEGEPWHPDFPPPPTPLALVVGNERAGIDPHVLHRCHRIIALPMRGQKRSVNVTVAFGVLAFWLAAKRPAATSKQPSEKDGI